jgi:hypothetical protein
LTLVWCANAGVARATTSATTMQSARIRAAAYQLAYRGIGAPCT